jgi:hypothetical protein
MKKIKTFSSNVSSKSGINIGESQDQIMQGILRRMEHKGLDPDALRIKQREIIRRAFTNWSENYVKVVAVLKQIANGKIGSMPMARFTFEEYSNKRELNVAIPLEQVPELLQRLREVYLSGVKRFGVRPASLMEKGDRDDARLEDKRNHPDENAG